MIEIILAIIAVIVIAIIIFKQSKHVHDFSGDPTYIEYKGTWHKVIRCKHPGCNVVLPNGWEYKDGEYTRAPQLKNHERKA